MSEFSLPLSQRDRGWIDLRDRLARAAREIHFVAIASDAVNGPVLLTLAESLAGLALSIPMAPGQAAIRGAAAPATLLVAQIVQRDTYGGSGEPSPIVGAEARRANG